MFIVFLFGAAVCLCTVLGLVLINRFDLFGTSQKNISSEFIEQEIREISELATLHHHYRKVASYQDVAKLVSYFPDWRINKSIKEFVLIYRGDVKLGYDLKDIRIHVDPYTKTIAIFLPEPKILSHSIDFESIDIISEKPGWFNEIKFEDFKKFFISEQKKYNQTNYSELKARAREQAQKIIYLYLSASLDIEIPSETAPEPRPFLERLIYPEKYKIDLKINEAP